MPDAVFADPRLASLYDALDPDRSDLDAYLAMADEFGARRVLDVGCGTGVFALLLADRGIDVVGVDPAAASLEVARAKPGADRVRFLETDATALPPLQVDLATMTANVAQVFLADDDWRRTLAGIRAALRPGGRLVFETRDPERRAWEDWMQDWRPQRVEIPGVGWVTSRSEVTRVDPPYVTFAGEVVLPGGTTVPTESTLRFRGREELERVLAEVGFAVEEVRDAPDRPGLELVYVATATAVPRDSQAARLSMSGVGARPGA